MGFGVSVSSGGDIADCCTHSIAVPYLGFLFSETLNPKP